MADDDATEDVAIPASSQPSSGDVAFDLEATLRGIVGLRAAIPDDAFTAQILGTERAGHGVVIDRGLVLTIGYLIAEAEDIWLTPASGGAVPAHLMAYDFDTGFGLVQAMGSLDAPALELGSARTVETGSWAVFAGSGGRHSALRARVVSKRSFAGYWEYLLDEAIFTAPAHPNWGGGALLDSDGKLVGIGSLHVQDATGTGPMNGNMSVPVDLLTPILGTLRTTGVSPRPRRPWLGLYATDMDDRLVVVGLVQRGPAHGAGARIGDVVLAVGGHEVLSLEDMLRAIGELGPAGVEIPLTLYRDGEIVALVVPTADRGAFLKNPRLH